MFSLELFSYRLGIYIPLFFFIIISIIHLKMYDGDTVNPRFWNRGFWNNLDSGMGFAADQN